MNTSITTIAPKPFEFNDHEDALHSAASVLTLWITANLAPLLPQAGNNPPQPFDVHAESYEHSTRAMFWTSKGLPWSQWVAPQIPPKMTGHDRLIWEENALALPQTLTTLQDLFHTHITPLHLDIFCLRLTFFRCIYDMEIGEAHKSLFQPLRYPK